MPALMEPNSSASAYPLLIKQLLHTPLVGAPDRQIVYSDRFRYDYRTLRARIGRLASALAALGVGPGDTVAMMDCDSHRYLESYFAIPMMGAVLMTVDTRLSPDRIAYTLAHSDTKVLLINGEFMPVFEAIRQRLDKVERVVVIEDGEQGGLPARHADEYEALLAAASPDFVFDDFDEHTRATTFYTTAGGDHPEGVYFSHRQLVLHTLALATALTSASQHGRIHRDDVYMPITPMYHVHAWGMPYVATMLGLKQVYPGRYAPDLLLELIRRERVTFSHCLPEILQTLLSDSDEAGVELRGWKVIIGGAALPQGLAQAALDRGIDIFSGYGMSETCPALTLAQIQTPRGDDGAPALDWRTKSGLPIPLVDLRIVDEEMRDVARDGKTAGEIVVRAPWLTECYFKNPEASERLWAGGYLHTDDIGVIDRAGHLQVTDRIEDAIKTGHGWISSLTLEDLIARHPAVSQVAVIGVKDATWHEWPLPLVVLKPGHSADAGAIRRHLTEYANRGEIPKYAVPDRVLFVRAIEKTSVGKDNKPLLRQKYQHT